MLPAMEGSRSAHSAGSAPTPILIPAEGGSRSRTATDGTSRSLNKAPSLVSDWSHIKPVFTASSLASNLRPQRQSNPGETIAVQLESSTVAKLSALFGRELTEDLSHRVSDLVTFDGYPDLLRGVPIFRVLHSCGGVLAGSTGSEETFVMSHQVDYIDYFISHNWSTSRWVKFIALAFHFNFNVAAMLSVSLTVVFAILQAYGILPSCLLQKNLEPYSAGLFCRVTFIPLFLLCVVFSHDFLSFCGASGAVAFLDKTCINQVDQVEQQNGIKKLGAFIARSRRMLVLYSDVYFLKVWTVYEVASFLAMHSLEHMEVVPVSQYYVFCMGLLILYAQTILAMILRLYFDFPGILWMCAWVVGLLYLMVLRRWAREAAAVKKRLNVFSVNDCSCFCESDRALVANNIAALMVASGAVDKNSSTEEALVIFDELVRMYMPKAVEAWFGRRTFRLKHYLLLGFAANGCRTLDYLSRFNQNLSCRDILVGFAHDTLWTFVMWPLLAISAEKVSTIFVHIVGLKEWVLMTTLLTLILSAPAAATSALFIACQNWAIKNDAGVAILIFANVCGFILVVLLTTTEIWCGCKRLCTEDDDDDLRRHRIGSGDAAEQIQSLFSAPKQEEILLNEAAVPEKGGQSTECFLPLTMKRVTLAVEKDAEHGTPPEDKFYGVHVSDVVHTVII